MYAYTVIPEMVYAYAGRGIPVAPKGYEISGFRPPQKGDWVLCNDGTVYECTRTAPHSYSPTLVCRPIPKKKVVTFRQIGYRVPIAGDWIRNQDYFTRLDNSRVRNIYTAWDIYEITETEE